MYVPIDYSEISKSIPEDDEILYSTLCQVKGANQNWESHVLITKLGIAYTGPTEGDQEKLNFLDWFNVYNQLFNEFKSKKIKINGIWFSATRDEKYETEETFKSRIREFGQFCEKLFLETKNEFIIKRDLDFIKNNSDVYVPIDYSDLYKLVPKDDEILYSTYCSLKFRELVGGGYHYTNYPPSHVLISRKGIALVDLIKKGFETQRPNRFIQWHKFVGLKFKSDGIRHGKPNKKKTLKVVRVGEFESEEKFNLRKDKFSPYCRKLYKLYTKYVSELEQSMQQLIIEKISEDNYKNAIEMGKDLLLAELSYKALRLYNEILKIIPEDERYIVMFYKGEAHRISGNYEEALKFYDLVLRLDPSNINALERKLFLHMEYKNDINYDDVKNMATLYKENIGVKSLVITPDSKFLISQPDAKNLIKRDLLSGEIIQTLKKSQDAHSLGISQDGHFLACGSWNGKISIWDLSTGTLNKSLKRHKGPVNSLVFSPDQKLLVSGSTDATIKVWDLSTSKAIQTIKGHNSAVRSTIYTPDGKFLISSAADKTINTRRDKTIKIWDISSWQLLKTFTTHDNSDESINSKSPYIIQDQYSINSIDISPDGNHIVSGSKDKTVEIWDFNSGSIVNTLKGHEKEVNTVKISPNGKYIVSGSNDKTIKIWDFSTGNLIKTLVGHTMEVNALLITSDNNYIISGSKDKNIIIWKGNLT